ncbi:Serine/threonine-protein kinase UL13 [Cacatuid alphaherpesvirus 2]|uniref:Serine/threonine-protein kinase UL13 n=1 Tax=Cacatuid alphaherpesvirus 2 TaxID=2604840 RepID=A0A5B9R2N0_9ALPH|nr:Serine/threonine-protein kinase UL13 [Cacatuid alphaherpesvirus 2]QEG54074.1 Serine/threonine-protein kinase UL13 [Cacatuid alphaherpesvirus 2]
MPNDPSKICLKVNSDLNHRRINLEPYVFLGKGGYGSVFYSRSANVAVKTLALSDAFRWELAVSLIISSAARRPELAAIAKHFLQVYAFSTIERKIVMEYMRHDLRAYMAIHGRKSSPTTMAAFAREFRGLSKALAFFHVECGLMHLDIKQENILVNCDPQTGDPERLVLADFSIVSINGNSFLNKCCMICPNRVGLEGTRIINTDDAVNAIASEGILMYRVDKRPPEFLIDYCNGHRYCSGKVMDAMTSLALDLFALGQVVQEIMLECLCHTKNFGIKQQPELSSGSCADNLTLLQILSYRIALTDTILHPWSDLGFIEHPAGTVTAVVSQLKEAHDREAFVDFLDLWRNSLRRRAENVIVPRSFRAIFNIGILLCHFDQEIRRSVPFMSP